MSGTEKCTDPYKGYVDIDLDGDEWEDSARTKHKGHGIRVLNIKNYGCIAVTWNGGKTLSCSTVSIPDVYAIEEDGKFVLSGQ